MNKLICPNCGELLSQKEDLDKNNKSFKYDYCFECGLDQSDFSYCDCCKIPFMSMLEASQHEKKIGAIGDES